MAPRFAGIDPARSALAAAPHTASAADEGDVITLICNAPGGGASQISYPGP
ncbi:MAG: hypothetical protein QG622_2336 [Actinomycetota bacterium]|nr:hypothetical protein [Actinomycetota bacterium]